MTPHYLLQSNSYACAHVSPYILLALCKARSASFTEITLEVTIDDGLTAKLSCEQGDRLQERSHGPNPLIKTPNSGQSLGKTSLD